MIFTICTYIFFQAQSSRQYCIEIGLQTWQTCLAQIDGIFSAVLSSFFFLFVSWFRFIFKKVEMVAFESQPMKFTGGVFVILAPAKFPYHEKNQNTSKIKIKRRDTFWPLTLVPHYICGLWFWVKTFIEALKVIHLVRFIGSITRRHHASRTS